MRIVTRKLGPVGIALTTWDLWRRLPPEYRRQIRVAAAKHGPLVAAAVAKRYRAYKSRVSS
jgi:TRAP-type C4-dicarboxylate transport system substrate-binding protein